MGLPLTPDASLLTASDSLEVGMEIYVLVKQVPDPEAIIKVKSDLELEIENKYFTSFFDEKNR